MFWTLIKLLVFVVAVIALAYGAGALMDSGQTVGLRILDMEFTLGPIQAIIAFVVLLVALWLVLKAISLSLALLHFMNGDETAIRRFFMRNREKRGLDALLSAMLAQSTGDSKTAMVKAEKAHKLLNRPIMTNLLIAQAAEAKGNNALALEHYKGFAGSDPAAVALLSAVQGLIRAELALGETERKRAHWRSRHWTCNPAPMSTDARTPLLKLQTEARGTGAAPARRWKPRNPAGHLPRDVYRRRDAVSGAARGGCAGRQRTSCPARRRDAAI